jgi:S-adenosylmethionine-diacylglycerol 3-amino-3-carboxypropyl transferase
MAKKSKFFEQINYASFHEDSNSERRGLQLKHSDRVLCLTGSGARPLDLLLDSPKEIIAIDWNPAQSHLLELKIAAIRILDYDACMTFLGFRSSMIREGVYGTLRTALSFSAREFWDGQLASIQRGVFFDGRWEKFLRRASWLARRVRHDLVNEVLGATDIAKQHSIWLRKWDNCWWRYFLAIVTNRLLVRYVLREPGLEFVPTDLAIGECLRGRFERASASFLFRESPWIMALFRGRIEERGPLPEHLKPENYDLIKRNIDGLKVVTNSLADYLHDSPHLFDAFSLSDFSSYCDQATYDRIWTDLITRAAPGARFCERRFLVNYALPTNVRDSVELNHELETVLNSEDRSVVYTFLIARLVLG